MPTLRMVRSEHLNAEERAYLDALDFDQNYNVLFSSTRPEYRPDRKDNSRVCEIRNAKIILKLEAGILILMGNLQCHFGPDFYGGAFYVHRVKTETTDFYSVRAVPGNINFTNGTPDSIQNVEDFYQSLKNDSNFEFSVSQFDEFIKVFEYYKTLSSQLNNNYSFHIARYSQEYYFMPSDEKSFDPEGAEEIKDVDGIFKGYRLDENDYDHLKVETQASAILVRDIYIKEEDDGINVIRLIKGKGDSLYLSPFQMVQERDVQKLVAFELMNAVKENGYFRLTGSFNAEEVPPFFAIYDMGQKIKIDSIDNSLRLINQGASGSAAQLLEYLIGDAPIPRGITPRNIPTDYTHYLNERQVEAFKKGINSSPVTVIKGPPGTGKTYVINAIVQYLTKERGEKVVISSQTHVAIDNVLDGLMSNYDCIIPNRITNRKNKYSSEYLDQTLYQTWGVNFPSFNKRATNEELAALIAQDVANFQGDHRFEFSEKTSLSDYSVIGATTTTAAISGKKGLKVFKGYDWLIIDEVSKCPITEVLRYLPYVNNIILVGDDFQLSPLLDFSEQDVKDLPAYDEDKFKQLRSLYESSVFTKTLRKAESSGQLVVLNENYRSVAQVLKTYNIFYNNELIGRREQVNPNKVRFSDPLFDGRDVFFIDVKNGKEMQDGTSKYNVEELEATRMILERLIESCVHPEKVTVAAIFPYAAQISRFTKKNRELINTAKKVFKSFNVDTVDAFQGKQAEIVLCDTVVTMPTHNFLNNFRRINVSMSRAKDKLFIFGNPITLSQIEMSLDDGLSRKYFADIIQEIRKNGQMITYTPEEGIKYEAHREPKIKILH